MRPSVIPWEFVDLIDRDPSRRVRLKIEQDRLARMHPSDLADILEELAPAEREALFSSLDEEVAAEALEEVDAKTQRKLLEGLNSEQIAGILEEMDPAAAADLLGEMSDERSESILEEMGEEERHEVEELLEFAPDSAAGLMTTDYVAVAEGLLVADAPEGARSLRRRPRIGDELFVVDTEGHLKAILALSRLVTASADKPLAEMQDGHLTCTGLSTTGRKSRRALRQVQPAVAPRARRPQATRRRHPPRARHRLAARWLLRILYAGEQRPGTSSLFRKLTLERLGHTVIGFEPHSYKLSQPLLAKSSLSPGHRPARRSPQP